MGFHPALMHNPPGFLTDALGPLGLPGLPCMNLVFVPWILSTFESSNDFLIVGKKVVLFTHSFSVDNKKNTYTIILIFSDL